MTGMSDINPSGDDGVSNLRAIFEILSYIHVDAQRDNHTELADRIDFALNLAEKMIKDGKPPAATGGDAKPQSDVGTAALKTSASDG
ncbi:MAG: hypothetical protein K9G33_05050 [Sneathiella sp.]|nr:hypothetical protein [Sneathiella sp.]